MKNSVIITKKMREDIAIKLTIKAVAKQAPKLAAKAKKMNDWYWEQHCKKVEKLSKINRKDWPQLIAEGMINGTVLVTPTVESSVGAKSGDSERPMFLIEGASAEAMSVFCSSEFQCLSSYIKLCGYYKNKYTLRFHNQSTVPALNRMEVISHAPTIAEAEKLRASVLELIEAIDEFHSKVIGILYSCKTSKQLEEILPEAAALIPAKPEPVKALLPLEQAKSVREMLKAGIPPVKVADDSLAA